MYPVPFPWKPEACFFSKQENKIKLCTGIWESEQEKVSWSPKTMIRESPTGMMANLRSNPYIQGTSLLEEENVMRKMMFKEMLESGAVVPGTHRQNSSVWNKQVMLRLDKRDWLVSEYHTPTFQ